MAIVFTKLLIPVDFTLNTEIAIKKAISLIGTDKAVLHLLHVVHPRRPLTALTARTQLDQLAQRTREAYPGPDIKTHVLKGSVQKMIIECANMLTPDMIVIGKQNQRHRWAPAWAINLLTNTTKISPDILARKTNSPVLTAKPGSIDSRTRVIVILIRDFLPQRKLEWGILLARRYRAQVHLLAIQRDDHEEALPQAFLKAYHQLRESLHHPIEFSAVTRHDLARATLSYAELIMADMILLNPATESGIGGSRHISDLLRRDSKIQVLDVEPYKNN